MKIQVFGSGCPTCKKLFEMTKAARRIYCDFNNRNNFYRVFV